MYHLFSNDEINGEMNEKIQWARYYSFAVSIVLFFLNDEIFK